MTLETARRPSFSETSRYQHRPRSSPAHGLPGRTRTACKTCARVAIVPGGLHQKKPLTLLHEPSFNVTEKGGAPAVALIPWIDCDNEQFASSFGRAQRFNVSHGDAFRALFALRNEAGMAALRIAGEMRPRGSPARFCKLEEATFTVLLLRRAGGGHFSVHAAPSEKTHRRRLRPVARRSRIVRRPSRRSREQEVAAASWVDRA